ncbi:hypothetical protein [Nostoc sp.]|uniref:hypothetical protein n=1 Tax=Nostoc sp. TaxID=1180 RepID=UPI002FFC25F0
MSESITLTDAGLLPEDLLPDVSHMVTKETALQRAERLVAQLRALGVEPEV